MQGWAWPLSNMKMWYSSSSTSLGSSSSTSTWALSPLLFPGVSFNHNRVSFPPSSTFPFSLHVAGPSSLPPMASPSSSTPSIPSSSPPPPTEDVSSSAHILEPSEKEGADVLFIFLPGAFKAPSEYFPLVRAVQASCEFRLWVVIVDPGNGAAVMCSMVEASFDGLLERVKHMGFQPGQFPYTNVFVGGHSWGAWESRAVAMKRAEAFIQLGSCFHTNPDNLVQYPKPVLTVSGELDGQIILAGIAKHAGEVHAAGAELGDFYMYAMKPVVIVPGMNHAQFADGIPNKERGDLDAEIPIEQARAIAANLISSFIKVHMTGPNKGTTTHIATQVLIEAVRQTHELYRTFWEAMDRPGRDVRKMQLELAALPSLTESNIGVVQHDYKDNFIYSKPFIDVDCRRIVINTYLSYVDRYKAVNNIWVKFKSREAVALAFGSSEEHQEPLSIGAYFNEKAFSQALDLVPAAAWRKFEERGKKLRFLDDLVIKSSQDWIDSDLILKPAEDGTEYVDLQSTALISPVQGVPARFAGMHYLKLLTVARAIQWIFVDCYR